MTNSVATHQTNTEGAAASTEMHESGGTNNLENAKNSMVSEPEMDSAKAARE
jgi:hypothetical protein